MIRIYPSKFQGTINAPASKAHAQRLLFMASLATFPSCIQNVPECDDIDTTLECLASLGCKFSVQGNREIYIDPFPKNVPVPTAELDFKDSSTACHLAIALVSTLGIKTKCTGSTALQRRRLLPLTSRLSLRGVKFSNFSLPCDVEGRLESGEYIFEGNEGSQNISALLLALPTTVADSDIRLASPLVDPSFVNLTIDSLAQFGITIEKTDYGYHIPGRQIYKSSGKLMTENDWGLASMWITAGAASYPQSNGVTVTNLPSLSSQGFRDVQKTISLLHYDFKYINIDASKCPDLATLFAAIAIVKGSNIDISGVPQLKNKECNRLKIMTEIARTMGQNAVADDDSISIQGNGHPSYSEDIVINCQGDPWIFMSMALAASAASIPFCLSDEHGADKAYRDFLKDYETLGGKFEIL